MEKNNPYRAPDTENSEDEATGSSLLLNHPRAVSVGDAVNWLSRGYALFVQQPGLWIGMILVYFVIAMVVNLIPLGGLAISIASPIFGGGFMYFCNRLRTNGRGDFQNLFQGFSSNAGPLAIVGLLTLAGSVVIVILLVIIGLVLFGSALFSGATMLSGVTLGSVGILLLMGTVLYIPLLMATIYAPALVMLHPEIKPLAAMVLSFKGCWANILPLIVLWFLSILIGLLAAIPLGLGLLVAIPVLTATGYAGYRHIFVEDGLGEETVATEAA